MTWTVIATTLGLMFSDGSTLVQQLPATAFPPGTIARTSESDNTCYTYTDTQLVIGGPGVGVTQCWTRGDLVVLSFVAGSPAFGVGATVML